MPWLTGGVLTLLLVSDVVSAGPSLPTLDIWGDAPNTLRDRDAKVLNFFPLTNEEECLSTDGRRKGLCLNTYECRIQGGKSFGICAFGFGVCCVFTATCGQEVINNITYFVNPDFPSLSHGMAKCELTIKKVDPEISQFRLDFIHFHLGQPNRRTGVCDEDRFIMSGASTRELQLCGVNSGQHVYLDVENLESPVRVSVQLGRRGRGRGAGRLWEVRVLQVPLRERAPAGCLQFHTGRTGQLQTMNFAENGRRLADQDYTICMRQERGMCSIAYEPCDENSFKIGGGSGGGGGGNGASTNGASTSGAGTSGGGTSGGGTISGQPPQTQGGDLLADMGSGDGPGGVEARACSDRIIMPCDQEDLLVPGLGGGGPAMCDLVRCGSSLCGDGGGHCRVESSTTPFTIGVEFGAAARDEPPDDNLGMCLRYEQLPCTV